MRHQDREEFAAAIKGVSLDEQKRLKQGANTRDPADDFASWHERFLHELISEFGPLPAGFDDDAASDGLDNYIKQMKKKFRLCLK